MLASQLLEGSTLLTNAAIEQALEKNLSTTTYYKKFDIKSMNTED